MRVLLVHCHPRRDSFSAALCETALSALEAAGHAVEVIDLYAENFDPRLSGAERGAYFDEAAPRSDLAAHIAALRRAEALVLVYPTWWFGLPAMLKGWFDRVWLPGVAFALGGAGASSRTMVSGFRKKTMQEHLRASSRIRYPGRYSQVLQPRLTDLRRIAVVTTYGSPRWLLWLVGWPDWRLFRFGIRPLCARGCRLDWIALTGMDTATETARARFRETVRRRLSAL